MFLLYIMSKNYYDVLGVNKDASQDEIKKKFRKLSLQHHPDRGGDAEKFKEIGEAYETLSDTEKRQQYDFGQTNPFMKAPGSGGGGMPFPPDIFNMMFGGGGIPPNMFGAGGPNIQIFRNGVPVPNPMQRPVPIIINVEISILQAYIGCKLPIELKRWILRDNEKQFENETIYIDIPKGIDENEIIIMKDKGNVINDTNKGEVKIFVKISNTTEFTRKGLDLFYKKTITLKEALCGFTFDMKYIDNKVYKINNSNGTVIQPNYKKIIQNMGLERNNHKGNLIIEFSIQFPETLSKETTEKLKDIL